jgi:hypothetical protein
MFILLHFSHRWSFAKHGIQRIHCSLQAFAGAAGDSMTNIFLRMSRTYIFMQNMHMTEVELEQCFEFIRDGEGFVDAEKWVSALASPLVKSAAASVIALAHED